MATTPETPEPRLLKEHPELRTTLENLAKQSREDSSPASMTRDEFLAKYLPES